MKVAYQFDSSCGPRLRKIFLKIKAVPKAPVARDPHEAKKKKSGWLHDSIWGHIKCGAGHDYGMEGKGRC